MKTLHLVSLLHAYQPWWQYGDVLDRIVAECYRPIFSFLLRDDRYHVALNIQWSLIELLHQRGHQDVLADLISLRLKTNRIEVTGSAAYHPLLPFIDSGHAQKQIVCQREKLSERLMLKATGFFPPEMAVSPTILNLIKKEEYRWTITDERAYRSLHGWEKVNPSDVIFTHQGLPVFLRDNRISESLAFKPYDGRQLVYDAVARFNALGLTQGFLIFANDIETYGHHRPYFWDQIYMQLVDLVQKGPVDGVQVELATPSEILDLYPHREVQIPESSWSWVDGNPFPLWCDQGAHARAHQVLWQMYRLAWQTVKDLPSNHKARKKVDQGSASCSWWWFAQGKPHFSLFSTKCFIEAVALVDATTVLSEMETLEKELKQRYGLN